MIMPLLRISQINQGTWLGIYQVEESEEELYINHPFLKDLKDAFWGGYKSRQRRLEVAATHLLLSLMIGKETGIHHFANGKPYISCGYNISLSHTKGYVAVIVSTSHCVAVDIEHRSDRVRRIAPWFVREEEQTEETWQMLLLWCAKETMYKLLSIDRLTLKDLPVSLCGLTTKSQSTGLLEATDPLSGAKQIVCFEQNGAFTLTFALKRAAK